MHSVNFNSYNALISEFTCAARHSVTGQRAASNKIAAAGEVLQSVECAARPTFLSDLAQSFKRCEGVGHGIRLVKGQLLCTAQEYFYSRFSQGQADKAYGKWQKEEIGLSPSTARDYVRYYKFCCEHLSGDAAASPPIKVVQALAAESTPRGVRENFVKMLSAGESVTVGMVRDAIQTSGGTLSGRGERERYFRVSVSRPVEQLDELMGELDFDTLTTIRTLLTKHLNAFGLPIDVARPKRIRI